MKIGNMTFNRSVLANAVAGIPHKIPNCFVVWGKKGADNPKEPYNPLTGQRAKADDPSTWVGFETAVRAVEQGEYAGIGIEFHPDNGIMGVDFDHSMNKETGEIVPEVLDWLNKLNSYTERSQSGTGFHVLIYGKKPGGRSKVKFPEWGVGFDGSDKPVEVEMYDNGRYFALTGDLFSNDETIKNAQSVADKLYSVMEEQSNSKNEQKKSPPGAGEAPREPSNNENNNRNIYTLILSDEEVLRKSRNGKDGAEFQALFDNGDLTSQKSDPSAADMRICNILAFYTNCDKDQMDRLFRRSALMRDKWDKVHDPAGQRTYGQMTIDKAVSSCTSVYTGKTGEAGKAPKAHTDSHKENAEPTIDAWFRELQPFEDEVQDEGLPSFPVDVLPDVIRAYALAGAESLQVPVEMAALPMLAGVAAAVQKKFIVSPKPDWLEPLSLWFFICALPSERKSGALQLTTNILYDLEQEMNASLAPEINEYATEKERLSKRRNQVMQDLSKIPEGSGEGKEEREELQKIDRELSELEKKPKNRISLSFNDITPERLGVKMAENHECGSIFSAEGGIIQTIAGRYNNGKANTDIFTDSFSGEHHRVSRQNGTEITLYHPALTMCLIVQPTIWEQLKNNDFFVQVGFAARFLCCYPKTIEKRRYETAVIPQQVREDYRKLLHGAVAMDYPVQPKAIRFSAEAHKASEAFFDKLEGLTRSKGAQLGKDGVQSFAGKVHGMTARLAAIFHICEHFTEAAEREVSAETYLRAKKVTEEYFLPHAVAAYDAYGGMSDTEVDAKILFENYILEKAQNGQIALTSLAKACRYNFRFKSSKTRAAALEELERRGYIRQETAKGSGRPVKNIYINPELIIGS